MFVTDLYLLKWEECIRDCNEVLRLEPMNLKGEYEHLMTYIINLLEKM